jgi:hypothetical protein
MGNPRGVGLNNWSASLSLYKNQVPYAPDPFWPITFLVSLHLLIRAA